MAGAVGVVFGAVLIDRADQTQQLLIGKILVLVGAVAAITGGRGGGRPDSAMAGGVDASKINDALCAAEEIVANMVK